MVSGGATKLLGIFFERLIVRDSQTLDCNLGSELCYELRPGAPRPRPRLIWRLRNGNQRPFDLVGRSGIHEIAILRSDDALEKPAACAGDDHAAHHRLVDGVAVPLAPAREAENVVFEHGCADILMRTAAEPLQPHPYWQFKRVRVSLEANLFLPYQCQGHAPVCARQTRASLNQVAHTL